MQISRAEALRRRAATVQAIYEALREHANDREHALAMTEAVVKATSPDRLRTSPSIVGAIKDALSPYAPSPDGHEALTQAAIAAITRRRAG